jgi:putative transposase
MKDQDERPNRKSIRMPSYDYSTAGAYFLTICVYNRRCILGDIDDGRTRMTVFGRMAETWWRKLPQRYDVELDAFVIMPNHLHGIVYIRTEDAGAHAGAPLQQIVRWFKTMSTNDYLHNAKENGWPPLDRHLWQRNYYEHVIRNDDDLRRIREYIANNPLQWTADKENPDYIPLSK